MKWKLGFSSGYVNIFSTTTVIITITTTPIATTTSGISRVVCGAAVVSGC